MPFFLLFFLLSFLTHSQGANRETDSLLLLQLGNMGHCKYVRFKNKSFIVIHKFTIVLRHGTDKIYFILSLDPPLIFSLPFPTTFSFISEQFGELLPLILLNV